MHIAWTALGEVVVVSFGVAVGLIVLFAIGVALLSPPTPELDRPRPARARAGTTTPRVTSASRRSGRIPLIAATGCFVACALCVAYALYVIIAR